MIKSWLMAAVALTMMTGIAAAQSVSSSTTTTQSTTAVPRPVPDVTTTYSTREHSVDRHGDVTDSGKVTTDTTSVPPVVDTTSTKSTTQTTTVR